MNTVGTQLSPARNPRLLSYLAAVLPRVRSIRQHCRWQSFLNLSSTRHRGERVRTMRQSIVYHPVPFDRTFQFRLPLRRTWWLRLAVCLGALCYGALVCASLLLL